MKRFSLLLLAGVFAVGALAMAGPRLSAADEYPGMDFSEMSGDAAATGGAEASGHSDTFRDVPPGHWAASAIRTAVEKGYVSGYPDGTFRPSQPVTRAEFMRMLVDALQLPHSQGGSPWYQPYVAVLLEVGIHHESDFHFMDYTQPISRLELVRLAVRATEYASGKFTEEDVEIVRKAVSTGLLHGMPGGDLQLSGKTTRAQAIAFIERVQSLIAGQKLPTDELAVEKVNNLQSDPWGRIIRTTNLPKNADQYPYILEGIPNEMYEMGYNKDFFPYGLGRNAKQFHERFKSYTRENIDKWLPGAEQWLNKQVNIDYRTIDYEWAETMADLQNYFIKRETILKDYKSYVDKVKKEKIKIVGNVRLEPSIMVSNDLDYSYMRAKVEFKIVSAENPKDVFNMIFQPKEGFKIGKWYRGYADVQLSNMISIPDTLIDMRPSSAGTTFFINNQFTIGD